MLFSMVLQDLIVYIHCFTLSAVPIYRPLVTYVRFCSKNGKTCLSRGIAEKRVYDGEQLCE